MGLIDKLTPAYIEFITANSPSWSDIIDVSEVVCITGMKRHGKSALTYFLAEELNQKYQKEVYSWGIPLAKQRLFPANYNHFTELHGIQGYYNSIITLDEIHRQFSARKSLSADNIEFSDVMTFSGQNNQILLLSTLNNGLIDINTFRICNPILIYKRVGNIQAVAERSVLRKFTIRANEAWRKIPRGRKNTPERALEAQLSYIISDQYIGWMHNSLPGDWWNTSVSEMHSKNIANMIKINHNQLTRSAMQYQGEYLDYCVQKANRTGGYTQLKRIQNQYPIEKFYVEKILKDEWDYQ